jgi:hypothetical protein
MLIPHSLQNKRTNIDQKQQDGLIFDFGIHRDTTISEISGLYLRVFGNLDLSKNKDDEIFSYIIFLDFQYFVF